MFALAKVFTDKTTETIIPIICKNVLSGSITHTDQRKTYRALFKEGYIHEHVTHKYELLNKNYQCSYSSDRVFL